MKEVAYVQKDATIGGFGAGYKAVTNDQVISVIRKSLVSNGIVIKPTQTDGEFLIQRDLSATPPIKMALYKGNYDVAFINIDKPDDVAIISIEAHANDNGDKAPGKALTYGVKAAIVKMFSLETGENEESRSDDFEVAIKRKSVKTRSDLSRYIQECGYTSQQVADGIGVSFSELDIYQAFDMVTHWKQQQ